MRSLSFVGAVLLIGIAALSLIGTTVAGDEEMCVPMGTIVLRPPSSVDAQRAAVEFQHGRHMVLACTSCHHTWEGAEPISGCMAAGCHDLDAPPRKADSTAIDQEQAFRYYKDAYHGQCIGCHRTMQQEIQQMAASLTRMDGKLPATGPTGCIGCHPKD